MSETNPRRRLPSVGSLAVAATVLVLAAVAFTLVMPHWRKLELLQRVEQLDGLVRSEYGGPERFRERSEEDDREYFMQVTEVRADGVDDAFLTLVAEQPALRLLSVSGRDISGAGMSELGAARSLEELLLIDAGLTDDDIRPLARITGLQELRLPHNAVEGTGFRQFPAQSELRLLDLTYCPVTDGGLRFIARLPKLQSLDLSGTAITNHGLLHLEQHPALTTLNLYGTQVGDEGVWSLARIPRLKEVVLMDTRVSETGRERLLELRPDCRIEIQTAMPSSP